MFHCSITLSLVCSFLGLCFLIGGASGLWHEFHLGIFFSANGKRTYSQYYASSGPFKAGIETAEWSHQLKVLGDPRLEGILREEDKMRRLPESGVSSAPEVRKQGDLGSSTRRDPLFLPGRWAVSLLPGRWAVSFLPGTVPFWAKCTILQLPFSLLSYLFHPC